MKWPYRVCWLPVLALVVPCVFIGLLGYRWLALEREAAGRRGADAARSAVGAVRHDLTEHVVSLGESIARRLGELDVGRPPFQPPPPLPPIVSLAFLFDQSGVPVAPNDQAAYEHAIEAHRAAAANPSWQRDYSRARSFEASGQQSHAITAARTLLKQSRELSLQASALLILARASAAAGQMEAAERYAREVMTCCAAARDEYGMSFALYAAWQLAALFDGQSRPHTTLVVRDLRNLVDRGYLGAASDVDAVALLAKKADGRNGFADVAEEVARAGEKIQLRIDAANLAGRWLNQTEASVEKADQSLAGTIRLGASGIPAMLVRLPDSRSIVMLLEPPEVGAWVSRWAAGHGSFDIRLASSDPVGSGADLVEPLFLGTPALMLALSRHSSDPATERSRQRLLATAVAGMLGLTLLIGYLATRDVLREMRTASLRSTFVAGMTHELKTPLASIRLLAETLQHGRARVEAKPELLETIVEETDRLGRLVDNLLSSARIESGTRVYHPQVVDICEGVRIAIRRFDYALKQEGFHIVERIDEARLPVNADPDALAMAVLNLLGNAVKYSGASREIRATVERHDGYADISVADDGIGIDVAEQSRIFESFYRSPQAPADTTGAGLGLALVHHFAQAHGGRVSVDSQPARGSVFVLRLPIARGSAVTSAVENGSQRQEVKATAAGDIVHG